ncbi:MAG TPA: metal ABC transporter permease [Bacilli bacterium]
MALFAEPFFQRALLGGILIGVTGPLIGMFLVLRRLSMIGDTIAHVSIAGVALGFLLNMYPIGVGLLFALAGSLLIEKLRHSFKSYAEMSIAIILSGGIALASLLFTMGKGFNINVTSYLFGSIYALDWLDIAVTAAVSLAVIAVIGLFFKELFILTFDEDAAKIGGLPTQALNLLVTVLTAFVIGVSIKIVGALLVSALLTVPAATSLFVARGFRHALIVAVMVAECAVIVGLLAAGVWNLAPGGTIVLLLIGIMLIVLFGKRGLKI